MIRTLDGRDAGAEQSGRRAAPEGLGPERAALWVPTVLGAATVLAAATEPAGAAVSLAHWLAVGTACASAVGLAVLLDDVGRLRATDAAWQPSAGAVLAPGTVVAAAALVLAVPRPAGFAPAHYAGVLIVATVLAPAVVGPGYLAVRARRLPD